MSGVQEVMAEAGNQRYLKLMPAHLRMMWCLILFCLVFQTRQPVFVQLLQGVFRVYHCNWLMPSQKASVESCIRVLSDVGKTWMQSDLNAANMVLYLLFTSQPSKNKAQLSSCWCNLQLIQSQVALQSQISSWTIRVVAITWSAFWFNLSSLCNPVDLWLGNGPSIVL